MNPVARPVNPPPPQGGETRDEGEKLTVTNMGVSTHKYLMRLSSKHAIEIHSDFDLVEKDMERISLFVSNKVRLGETSITFPPMMRAELKIRSVAVVNLPPKEECFKPASGLECFAKLYGYVEREDGKKADARICKQRILSGEPISFRNYSAPEAGLVAFAEYVKELEEKGWLPKEEISALKDHLKTLKKIFDEEIPDAIVPLHVVSKKLGVSEKLDNPSTGTFNLRGEPHKVAYIVSLIDFLKDGLGLYEIFSKEFAEHLISCLKPVAHNLVEIGAGRGMLSASLGECEKKVLYVSDLFPPPKTWKDIRVAKKSAEEVTEKYCNDYKKVIYLSSQSDIGMVCRLIESGNPMLILQTGFTNPVQLSKYGSKLKIIDLNIPGYSGHYAEDRVRLLACNVPEEDFQLVKGKVPGKYRVSVGE